ncbi:MAG: UDP-N-acetylmuramate dehydrogenase [Rhodoblastus sp.]
MPELRGRLSVNEQIAPFTWFRVGGPAQVLFQPADEDDLSYFLSRLSADIPVFVFGLGSNLIVRDGGVPGVTIRLGGKAFADIAVEDGHRLRAGAAAPDRFVAKRAAELGVAGLEFLSGIPGAIGGALRMNAGAHGGEMKDIVGFARGVARSGEIVEIDNAGMGFSYRHSSAPRDVIFTSALLQGRAGDKAAIQTEMDRITQAREKSQPIREKTGGSTFKNPPGEKAWQLVDKAGCRGLLVGGAQVSEMHCNFLINRDNASAADIEALGEEVRRRVRETSGVQLEWEIKRVGVAG